MNKHCRCSRPERSVSGRERTEVRNRLRLVHSREQVAVLSLTEAKLLDQQTLRQRFAEMIDRLLPRTIRDIILRGRNPRTMTRAEILDFLAANAAWLEQP